MASGETTSQTATLLARLALRAASAAFWSAGGAGTSELALAQYPSAIRSCFVRA